MIALPGRSWRLPSNKNCSSDPFPGRKRNRFNIPFLGYGFWFYFLIMSFCYLGRVSVVGYGIDISL